MSQFIESIKVEDQKIFLLDLHQKRVNDTFAHFGKEGSIDLGSLFNNLQHDEDGLYKLKITYDLNKNFRTHRIKVFLFGFNKVYSLKFIHLNFIRNHAQIVSQ